MAIWKASVWSSYWVYRLWCDIDGLTLIVTIDPVAFRIRRGERSKIKAHRNADLVTIFQPLPITAHKSGLQ